MDNPLIIRTLDAYSDIYDRLQSIPIRWDKKRRRFEIVSDKTLIPWYCSMISMPTTVTVCLYILGNRVMSKQYHVKWFNALVFGFVAFTNGLGNIDIYYVESCHTLTSFILVIVRMFLGVECILLQRGLCGGLGQP